MNYQSTTKNWTDSMDHELKESWGIVPLKSIIEAIGKPKKELIKRSKILKINGGYNTLKTIDEFNSLSTLIEETNCNIKAICNFFDSYQISDIYEKIEHFKTLSNVPAKTPGRRGKYVKWTDEEDYLIRGYITQFENLYVAKNLKTLLPLLPGRSERGIVLRIAHLKKKPVSTKIKEIGVDMKNISPINMDFILTDITETVKNFSSPLKDIQKTYCLQRNDVNDNILVSIQIKRGG